MLPNENYHKMSSFLLTKNTIELIFWGFTVILVKAQVGRLVGVWTKWLTLCRRHFKHIFFWQKMIVVRFKFYWNSGGLHSVDEKSTRFDHCWWMLFACFWTNSWADGEMRHHSEHVTSCTLMTLTLQIWGPPNYHPSRSPTPRILLHFGGNW